MALARTIPQLVALAELGCSSHLGRCTHLDWGSHLGCCSPGLLLQAVTSFCPLIWQQPGPGCGEAAGSLSTGWI